MPLPARRAIAGHWSSPPRPRLWSTSCPDLYPQHSPNRSRSAYRRTQPRVLRVPPAKAPPLDAEASTRGRPPGTTGRLGNPGSMQFALRSTVTPPDVHLSMDGELDIFTARQV